MFPLAGRHYSISGCCLANSVENFWGYLFRHFTCCICEVDSPIFTRVICGGHALARTQARSAPSCSRLGQVVRTIPTVPNGPHRRPNTRASTQALVKRLISVSLNHPDYPMLPPSEKAKLRKILIPLSSSDHILVRGSLLRPFADSKNSQVEALIRLSVQRSWRVIIQRPELSTSNILGRAFDREMIKSHMADKLQVFWVLKMARQPKKKKALRLCCHPCSLGG